MMGKQRAEDWEEITKEEVVIREIQGRTYIGFMGALLKFYQGKVWRMDRDEGEWIEIDFLTMKPIQLKGEVENDINY